jgi:beta-phosphoglucomutase family hydrolase
VLALIFDMDGVLVDSNPLHCRAWEEFNRHYGMETTAEMHQRMYGNRNDQIVRDVYGDGLDEAEVFHRGRAKEALFRELAAPHVGEMLVPGVREFLDRYHYLPKAVATNADPENVNFLLERADLRAHFQAVVDGDQVQRPKPYPDIYLRTAELLGVQPANCVVFEDSHSGVAAGVAAGMRVIGLATTHVNLPGTSITVDNFSCGELALWLEAQNRAC